MTKKHKILLGAAAACLLVCLCVVLVMFGGSPDAEPATTAGNADVPVTYTVQVKNQGGLFLPNVGVYIYEDNTLGELVWFAKTDDSGKMTFTDKASDSYVAVLADVPTGYAVEQMYPITGELTEIILSAAQMSEVTEDVTYKLGDMMMDFTVEDAEGDTYTLSKLLEQKKAVVLNFWYTTCGPCKAEFPFLQEAYEKHKDNIAVLAMNPVNTAEEVAQFQKEMGLTFPMMACDPLWADMMQITAYPTTVVVDRYGNITLIHKGSIDSTKMFEDVFTYFTAEDYQQKIIQDIKDLETEAEEGTEENPVEIGGVLSFEVTVKPGETVYSEVYKVTGMYMQVQGKDYKLLYNNKEYTPTKGVVGLVVTTGDVRTPAQFGITNTGTETATYKFAFSFLPGTMDNPYAMKLGEFDVSVPAGSEKGVYYTYTAAEDGILTVQCLSVTPNVKYGYTLYNLDNSRQHTLDSEGEKDENGIPTLSIEAKKGQTVQFIASTFPDDSGNYPAATMKFLASFSAGEIKEEEKVETVPYTVVVKDSEGNPIPNVGIAVQVGDEEKSFSTDETGVASIQLEPGTYQGSFTLPEGYEPVQSNTFEFTADRTSHEIVLTKIVIVIEDYTVRVTDEKGNAVAGVKIKIGSTIVTTGENGCAVFTMEKDSYTAAVWELPESYIAGEDSYAFPQDKTELSILLAVKPGTAGKPYAVAEYPYDTPGIQPGEEQYYTLSNAGGMVLGINNAAAYVIYDGIKYVPDDDGRIAVILADSQEPVSLIIGNTAEAAKYFVLNLSYPVGARENPEVLELGTDTVSLAAGNTKGYYYTWTAQQDGTVHFALKDITQGAKADIILKVGDTTVKLSDTPDASEVSVWVDAGDIVSAQVLTLQDAATGDVPAAQITIDSSFRLPPNSARYPDTITDVSSIQVTLAEGDADGWFYTWTPANSGVASFKLGSIPEGIAGDIILKVAGKDTVVKLSDGMTDSQGNPVAAITVARGDALSIQITADAKAAEVIVKGGLAQDPNSAENPDALSDITSVSTNLVAGDEGGHYYVWTAADAGTVSMTIDSITQGVTGRVTLYVNGVAAETTCVDVKAGDEVLIQVGTLADSQTGEHPAAQITLKGSFAYALGSVQNPQVVTSVEKLTATLEAGNDKGYHYQYTAQENCTLVFRVSNYTAVPTDMGRAEDLAQLADVVLYVNGVRKNSLSENEDKDADGNRVVSVAVKKGDLVAVQVLTKPGTDGQHSGAVIEVSSRMEIRYTVTVTDMFGKAQPGVSVTVWDAFGSKVHTGTTDTSGVVAMTGAPGTYRAELAFEGTVYYYNEAAAVFSTERTSVTVQLANYLNTENVYEDWWVINEADTYYLEQGSTYVELGKNKSYYSDEIDGSCLFIFCPTEGGTYRFSVDNPNVELAYRGSSFYPYNKLVSTEGSEDHSFTYSVSYGSAGNMDMVIGIKVPEGVAGVVVSISRVGEPNWSIEDEPWSTDWQVGGHTHTAACKHSGNVTYLDINAASGTYELYYNEGTGFYQLSENGPVILVDMNSSILSFHRIIMGDGAAGGAPIRRYFYDANGKFVKKEDYTNAFVEYFNLDANDNPQSWYHPLTKDLMYMIQNGGANWWDASSPNFNTNFAQANPEYAWMFACCYKS